MNLSLKHILISTLLLLESPSFLLISVFLFSGIVANGKSGSTFSYNISDEKKCMNKGEADCLNRNNSVTGEGLADGPAKVGGTPTKNPYNEGCSFPPPTNKHAFYSSFGLDPSNPANASKYNLKKLGPIEGWPGEFHLDPDGEHAAWRLATIIRALKEGAYTLEADNSDNPLASKAKVIAQLDRECDILSAAGRPCTLKNSPDLFSKLKKRPTYWILETGQDNGGTSLIKQASSMGISPDHLFIVHYGPVSPEVCGMVPGSHVVFSKSLDLTASNLSPCPDAPKGGSPMSAPPKIETPQCGNQEQPPNEEEPQKPSAPYAGNDSGIGPSGSGISAGGGSPRSYPLTAQQSKEAPEVPKQNVPFSKGEKGLRLPDSAVTSAENPTSRTEGFPKLKQLKGNKFNFSDVADGAAYGAAAGAANQIGGNSNMGVGGPGLGLSEKEKQNPSSTKAATSAFGSKFLGDPKISLNPSDIDSAVKKLEKEFEKKETPLLANLEEGTQGNVDVNTIFFLVHQTYHRVWLRGQVGK